MIRIFILSVDFKKSSWRYLLIHLCQVQFLLWITCLDLFNSHFDWKLSAFSWICIKIFGKHIFFVDTMKKNWKYFVFRVEKEMISYEYLLSLRVKWCIQVVYQRWIKLFKIIFPISCELFVCFSPSGIWVQVVNLNRCLTKYALMNNWCSMSIAHVSNDIPLWICIHFYHCTACYTLKFKLNWTTFFIHINWPIFAHFFKTNSNLLITFLFINRIRQWTSK